MKVVKICLFLTIAILCFNLIPGPTSAIDGTSSLPRDDIKLDANVEKIATDWQQLQGKWERFVKLPTGETMQLVKTVQDRHESLKGFDAKGNLLFDQVAELKIEIRGNLHVILWSKAEVIAGPRQGAKIPNGTAVFTFKEGHWIAVCGLAEGEAWGVYVEDWARVKPEVPNALETN